MNKRNLLTWLSHYFSDNTKKHNIWLVAITTVTKSYSHYFIQATHIYFCFHYIWLNGQQCTTEYIYMFSCLPTKITSITEMSLFESGGKWKIVMPPHYYKQNMFYPHAACPYT